jgi:hypothetical protein
MKKGEKPEWRERKNQVNQSPSYPKQVIADIASQSPAAAKHRPTHITRQVRVDLTVQELANLSNG